MRNAYDALKRIVMWIVALLLITALVNPVEAKRPGGGTVSHTAKQTPPIQLGTSGGWQDDLANGYCCGGTLGSLVQDREGRQYILSNYHVLAGDVDCEDGFCLKTGNFIIQPGLIDVSCNRNNAQQVATLSAWADPLAGTNIDAAIAEVASGMVRGDGSILEIGTISAITFSPSLNLAVKKSGRTTGLTRSKITGLNATILISYDTECAGLQRGTATFTGQIVIGNRGSKFLAGGDSGSLLVEDVATNPRAIGLLYAGSSSVAIANPIHEILDFFDVTMVGVQGVQGSEVPAAVIEEAKKAQARHTARLERVPGGVGHGIGLGRSGQFVIHVYVEKDAPEVQAAVPDSVDGIPVEIEETGRIVPLLHCR